MAQLKSFWSLLSTCLFSAFFFVFGRPQASARPVDEDIAAGSTQEILKRIKPPRGEIVIPADVQSDGPLTGLEDEGSDEDLRYDDSDEYEEEFLEEEEDSEEKFEDLDEQDESQKAAKGDTDRSSSKNGDAESQGGDSALQMESQENVKTEATLSKEEIAAAAEEAAKKLAEKKKAEARLLKRALKDGDKDFDNAGCFTLLVFSCGLPIAAGVSLLQGLVFN